MEYEGYKAKITYLYLQETFRGDVLNIRGVPPFFGTTVEELRQEFKERVNEHISLCIRNKAKRIRPYNGKLVIKIPPELHEDLAMKAIREDVSVNALITKILYQELQNDKQGTEEKNDELF